MFGGLKLDRGLSDFDRPQRLTITYLWAVPGPRSGWSKSAFSGWQLAGTGSMVSVYNSLPVNNWGSLGQLQMYGKDTPIQDCRSGTCVSGYLWYNGYIPAQSNPAGRFIPARSFPEQDHVPLEVRPAMPL